MPFQKTYLLGAEGLVFQHSWEVLLDGGNSNPVEIANIENKNGVLEIEWEKYERFNFQKYILYKFGNKNRLERVPDGITGGV